MCIVQIVAGVSIMGGAIGSSFTPAPMGTVASKSRIGNWSEHAEFNILVDPEAASFLLSHPTLSLKTTLIPLDVTHLVLATPEVQELLHYGKNRHVVVPGGKDGKPSTLRQMLIELLNFFAKTYADVFGITAGPPLHDPLAVAAILDGLVGVEIPFYDYLPVPSASLSSSSSTNGNGKRSLDASKSERRERYKVEVVTAGTHEEALAGAQTGRTIATLLPDGEEGVKIPRGLDVRRFWSVIEECLVAADEVNRSRGVV